MFDNITQTKAIIAKRALGCFDYKITTELGSPKELGYLLNHLYTNTVTIDSLFYNKQNNILTLNKTLTKKQRQLLTLLNFNLIGQEVHKINTLDNLLQQARNNNIDFVYLWLNSYWICYHNSGIKLFNSFVA